MDELTPEQIADLQAKAAKVDELTATNASLKAAADEAAALKADNASLKAAAAKVDDLEAENEKLKAEYAQMSDTVSKSLPLSFDVEADDEANDIAKGTYEFTAPTLTWDDNQVYNLRELSASAEKKEQALYAEICAKLLQRKSGLVRLRS